MISDEKRRQIAAAFAEGASVAQLARDHGLTTKQIEDLLRAAYAPPSTPRRGTGP